MRPRQTIPCAIAVLASAGCMVPYRAGTLLERDPMLATPNTQQVGCLDVRVTPANEFGFNLSEPVLRVEFGNRCDRPIAVDFTTLRARTRYADGQEFVLGPMDPRHEIRRGRLELRTASWEMIAFGESPAARPPAWVCLDVGQLNADQPTNQPAEICVPGPDAAELAPVTPPVSPSATPTAAPWSPAS